MNLIKRDDVRFAHKAGVFVVGSTVIALSALVWFEPVVLRAVSDEFTVSQSIIAEIAFDASASDVVIGPAIPGLSGGVANGSTDVRVITNNPTGYALNVAFSSSTAMQGSEFGGVIPNYTPTVSTTPDFTFAVGPNTGEFGYTVESEDVADVAPLFQDDGASCGGGGQVTADSCWFAPSVTDQLVVNRSTFTDSDGVSTTIKFRVQLTPNPDPLIPADTYTATTTLTAVMN